MRVADCPPVSYDVVTMKTRIAAAAALVLATTAGAHANEIRAGELYIVVKVNEQRVASRDTKGALASLATAIHRYRYIEAPRDVCVTAARNLASAADAIAAKEPEDTVSGLLGAYYGALGGCEMLLGKRQSKQVLLDHLTAPAQ
jgi:ribulose-5-phosphate 4-epimerase/fuculose-1-phosphate aldolase